MHTTDTTIAARAARVVAAIDGHELYAHAPADAYRRALTEGRDPAWAIERVVEHTVWQGVSPGTLADDVLTALITDDVMSAVVHHYLSTLA